jgi:CBS-domain-containing membrane protein
VPGVDEQTASRNLALRSVAQIIAISPRDTFAPLDARDKCSLLVQLFATGIHRCPLIDGEGKLTGLVTQADVINELNKEFHQVKCVVATDNNH